MRVLDLPPVWLLLCLALAWASPGKFTAGWMYWPGVLCLILAAGLVSAALIAFWRARTTVIPHQVPSALITEGVFRFSRNPIYLADILILIGFALKWGSLVGLVLVPVLFFVLERRFIRAEEARLMAKFPDAFPAYCQITRRWL